MTFDVIELSDAPAAMGLPRDEGGLPRSEAVAGLIRDFLGVRRAVHETELLHHLTSLSVALGYPEDLALSRIQAVLRVLVATGDAAALATADGMVIMATTAKQVAVCPAYSVRLGGPGTMKRENPAHPSEVLRRTATHSDDIPFTEALGEPSYRSMLRALNIPADVPMTEVIGILRASARMNGQTPDSLADRHCLFELDAGETSVFGGAGASVEIGIRLNDSRIRVLRIDHPDAAGWIWLVTRGADFYQDWPAGVPMPAQVLTALAFAGRPLDDSLCKWTVPEETLAGLLGWLGFAEEDCASQPGDAAQREVIIAPANARLLVEAGPGSGKTWVLCSRVRQLVDAGVTPTHILVISFTRAAVSEIRDRIAGFLEDRFVADAIRIVTLDSLASRLRSQFQDDSRSDASGYDVNVAETLELIRAGDNQLLEYIEGFEHVLVDEAQDLTGSRRDLVVALLQRLLPESGATVFHDPAQAIYGFSGGEPSGIAAALNAANPGFATRVLTGNYRTRSPTLLDLFATARQHLRDAALEGPDLYERVRSSIEASLGSGTSTTSVHQTNPADGTTFFLYRSRAAVCLAASQLLASGLPFRIRLPSQRDIVQPWIGALLRDETGATIAKSAFDRRWAEARPLPPRSKEGLWSDLFALTGLSSGNLDLHSLAVRLSDERPPLAVTQTDIGPSAGPLLSTIHAAKGREADTVHLMLPRHPEDTSAVDWEEEARILFVGATRARKTLRVGSSSSWLRPLDGRGSRLWQSFHWRGRKDARVEVGIDGDVDNAAMIDETVWHGALAVAEMQTLLWHLASKTTPLAAVRSGDFYSLEVADGRFRGRSVGRLTKAFVSDMWKLGTAATGARVSPPRKISGIYLTAVRTISAWQEETGTSRFWLAPVIAGLPVIYLDRRSGAC